MNEKLEKSGLKPIYYGLQRVSTFFGYTPRNSCRSETCDLHAKTIENTLRFLSDRRCDKKIPAGLTNNSEKLKTVVIRRSTGKITENQGVNSL